MCEQPQEVFLIEIRSGLHRRNMNYTGIPTGVAAGVAGAGVMSGVISFSWLTLLGLTLIIIAMMFVRMVPRDEA